MAIYQTTLWLDDQECGADVHYSAHQLEPSECGSYNVPGQHQVEIDRVELYPTAKVRTHLETQIEIALSGRVRRGRLPEAA